MAGRRPIVAPSHRNWPERLDERVRRRLRVVNQRNQIVFAYSVIVPIMLWFFIFVWYPVFRSFFVSLFDWIGFIDPRRTFIGLGNYRKVLSDTLFHKALSNTLVYTLELVGFGMILIFITAIALEKVPERVRSLARTVYFVPVITSLVACGLVWKLLYEPNYGLFNAILGLVGIRPQMWLRSPYQALQSIIIMSLWKSFGFYVVILLAGLQNIPEDLISAGKVDGAEGWKNFRYITLPLLLPTVMFILVMWFIGALQVFTEVYVLTTGGAGHGVEGGGPAYSTTTVVFRIVREAFQYQKYGFGAAMSIVLFIIILLITLIQFRLLRSNWEY